MAEQGPEQGGAAAPVPEGIPHVEPRPVDITWAVGEARRPDGVGLVALRLETPIGAIVTFWPSASARAIAAAMAAHADRVDLVVPQGIVIPPMASNGHGHLPEPPA